MVRSPFSDDEPVDVIDDLTISDLPELDIDPDRIAECEYWRCGDLFERRSVNHRFCRKACRSRQHKWARAQVRKARREQQRRERRQEQRR